MGRIAGMGAIGVAEARGHPAAAARPQIGGCSLQSEIRWETAKQKGEPGRNVKRTSPCIQGDPRPCECIDGSAELPPSCPVQLYSPCDASSIT
jgi:hypothetical protein